MPRLPSPAAPAYTAPSDAPPPHAGVRLPGSAPESAGPTGPACANCGTPAPGPYCPACGQAQHEAHRSLRSITGELLDTFAGWDGKIPVTLWLLVRHPGRLTAEYVAGRRVRYLRPLRLYLSLTVLVLLAQRVAPDRGTIIRIGDFSRDTPGAVGPASGGAYASGPWQRMKRSYFGPRIRDLERLPPKERNQAVSAAFLAKLGNMFFALLPVFALFVGALYRRSPLAYAEHFVFALHVHAFGAAALALGVALGGLHPATRLLPLLWAPPYLFVALRTVYGGSRARTLVKLVALGGSYLIVLLLATLVTAALAFFVG
jgi:hypothetical protein